MREAGPKGKIYCNSLIGIEEAEFNLAASHRLAHLLFDFDKESIKTTFTNPRFYFGFTRKQST
jgi:hypothetical protein